MRLFLLLAFAFALISIALVVSQHPSFVEQTRQFMDPESADAGPNASGLIGPPNDWQQQFDHTTTIGLQDEGWQALSGFPSFARLSFPLPRNAALVEGRLRLQLHSQLVRGGVGSVRVSINNERRAELVLNPGEEPKTLLLALSAEDLARPNVVVSLAAQGDAFQGACPSRPTRGVVVDILPGTSIELAHSAPLSDPFDIWLANRSATELVLVSDATQEARADQLLLAARLNQAAINPLFTLPKTVPDAGSETPSIDATIQAARTNLMVIDRTQKVPLSFDAGKGVFVVRDPNLAHRFLGNALFSRLTDLISDQADTLPAGSEQIDPNAIAANSTAQSFYRSNRWRVDYDLIDREQGDAPARLQLALKIAEQQLGEGWIVNVMLNDSLISSDRLNTASEGFAKAVNLPAALVQPKNEITIDLSSTDSSNDLCNPGLQMTAQLLPDSKLEGAAFMTPDLPAYVIQTLARRGKIVLRAEPALGPLQAAASAQLLAHILPKDVTVAVGADAAANKGEVPSARIDVLNGAGLEARLNTIDLPGAEKRYWIVSQDTSESSGEAQLKIIPLSPQFIEAEILSLVGSAMFLLIEA